MVINQAIILGCTNSSANQIIVNKYSSKKKMKSCSTKKQGGGNLQTYVDIIYPICIEIQKDSKFSAISVYI